MDELNTLILKRFCGEEYYPIESARWSIWDAETFCVEMWFEEGRNLHEDTEELEDVTVTGGWFSVQGTLLTRLSEEHVKAEIFEIKGISADVAVAVKFLEKMDAATTDHFYVILNPQADLTPVQAYVIPDETQGEGPVPE